MQTIAAVKPEPQGPSVRPLIHSASISRRHYAGPRLGRRPVRFQPELSAHDRLVLLRSQLRLLRLRAQAGLPVTPAAIGRAELLANSLEDAA